MMRYKEGKEKALPAWAVNTMRLFVAVVPSDELREMNTKEGKKKSSEAATFRSDGLKITQ